MAANYFARAPDTLLENVEVLAALSEQDYDLLVKLLVDQTLSPESTPPVPMCVQIAVSGLNRYFADLGLVNFADRAGRVAEFLSDRQSDPTGASGPNIAWVRERADVVAKLLRGVESVEPTPMEVTHALALMLDLAYPTDFIDTFKRRLAYVLNGQDIDRLVASFVARGRSGKPVILEQSVVNALTDFLTLMALFAPRRLPKKSG